MVKLTPAQTAWLDQYSQAEPTPESTIQWIYHVAAGNKKVQKMMIKFPPSCVVMAKPEHILSCPPPGQLGIVVNMGDKELKVVQADVPGTSPKPWAGMCDPAWLKVVGYWKGLTPDVVKSVLKSFGN